MYGHSARHRAYDEELDLFSSRTLELLMPTLLSKNGAERLDIQRQKVESLRFSPF